MHRGAPEPRCRCGGERRPQTARGGRDTGWSVTASSRASWRGASRTPGTSWSLVKSRSGRTTGCISPRCSRTPRTDLNLVGPDVAGHPAVELVVGDCVAAIDRSRRLVTSAEGRQLSYDALVLATGSYPFVPGVPGRDRAGCFVYRTVADVDAIRAWAAGARRGVVVGGGTARFGGGQRPPPLRGADRGGRGGGPVDARADRRAWRDGAPPPHRSPRSRCADIHHGVGGGGRRRTAG